MRAAILNAIGEPFSIDDIDIDRPTGREVLVEIRASGLCHSDLGVATVDLGFPLPACLGHEISGVVVAIGPEAREFAPGQRVVACPISWCDACRNCRRGMPYRCLQPMASKRSPDQTPRLRRDGVPVLQFINVGGFAQQALVPEQNLVALPEGVPFDAGALLGCGVATGAGAAINAARVRPGDTVAVIGCGGVGLNVVQGAAIAGASRIVAVDLAPEKLELARAFGATDVVAGTDGDVVEAVRALTGGVDAAFEVVGRTETVQQAVGMLAKGGCAYLIGVQRPGARLDLDLPAFANQQFGLRGIAMGSTNPKVDLPVYAEMYLQGRLKLDELISRRIRLDEINEAYDELRRGAMARAVITDF